MSWSPEVLSLRNGLNIAKFALKIVGLHMNLVSHKPPKEMSRINQEISKMWLPFIGYTFMAIKNGYIGADNEEGVRVPFGGVNYYVAVPICNKSRYFSRNEHVAMYFPENPFADITLFLNSIPTFIT